MVTRRVRILASAANRVARLTVTNRWPELTAMAFALSVAILCSLFFFDSMLPWILFPADVLTWSESGFVGNVIKLKVGSPLYLAPERSNSVIYTPAAPVVSYGILKFLGVAVSVPALRLIQKFARVWATFSAR